MGKVIVRLTVGPDGKKNYTILGHKDGSTCHNTDGEKLLKRLIDQNVPGFGGGGDVVDGGKTAEFFESKGTKTVAPLPVDKGQSTFDDSSTEVKERKQDLGLGFGT